MLNAHEEEAVRRRMGVAEIRTLQKTEILSGEEAESTLQQASAALRWGTRDLVLLCGGLFVAAAILYFFAWNWSDLAPMWRLGILQTGIVLSIVAGWNTGFRTRAGTASLFSATFLTGILSAVYGQIYQRGADSYEVFAWWAGLSALWTFCSRSAGLWSFWLAILQSAFLAWWFQVIVPAHGREFTGWGYLCVGGFLVILLVVREFLSTRKEFAWLAANWVRYLTLAATLYVLSVLALRMILHDNWYYRGNESAYLIGSILWAIALVGGFIFYGKFRRSFTCLWLLTISFCFISSIFYVERGEEFSNQYDELTLLPIGLCILGTFAVAGMILTQCRIRWIRDEETTDENPQPFLKERQWDDSKTRDALKQLHWKQQHGAVSWQIRSLQSVGMWLAGFILAVWVMVEFRLYEEGSSALIIGLILAATGVFAGRFVPVRGPHLDQIWLGIALTGQLLIFDACQPYHPYELENCVLIALLMALVIYPISQNVVQRYVSCSLFWLFLNLAANEGGQLLWWILSTSVPALVWMILLCFRNPALRPLMFSAAMNTFVAQFMWYHAQWRFIWRGDVGHAYSLLIPLFTTLILGIGFALHFWRGRLQVNPENRGKLVALSGLSALTLCPPLPAILGGLVLGRRRLDRFLLGIAAVWAPIQLHLLYLNQFLSLPTKAALVGAFGLGCIVLGYRMKPEPQIQ